MNAQLHQHQQQQQLVIGQFPSERQPNGQDSNRIRDEARTQVRYPTSLEVTTLAKQGVSATVFSTRTVGTLFDISELLDHTVYSSTNGGVVKPKLDPSKVEWIRVAVSGHFSATSSTDAKLWKKCVVEMNAYINSLSKKIKNHYRARIELNKFISKNISIFIIIPFLHEIV
jgi:hypothetical protein